MAEGKDLMWLALPFCAGIVLGNISESCLRPLEGVLYLTAWAAPILIISLSAILLHRVRHKNANPASTRICIIAIFLLSGAFCSITSSLTTAYSPKGNPFDSTLQKSRETVEHLIDSIPYGNEEINAVAKALLTGNRTDLSRETKSYFRQSGASHLLALSGMHLGIIYMIFSKLLALTGNRPRAKLLKYLTIISATWFYSGMTGWSASIVRAMIFIMIRETAAVMGRRCSTTNSLSAALIIQCAIEPKVVSSVSFQMSYLAMTGIALIFPRLRDLFPKEGTNPVTSFARKIWECAALSISCQLTTGPLAWWKFGSAPLYFLITNLMAIPITTAAIPATIIAAVGRATGILTDTSAKVSEYLLESLIFTLKTISTLNT